MNIRFYACSKDGQRIHITFYGCPFYKWLQAVLHIGWSRKARRRWRDLAATVDAADLPLNTKLYRKDW